MRTLLSESFLYTVLYCKQHRCLQCRQNRLQSYRLCEDYDFYNGENEASSIPGSLFRYFKKFSKWENAWEDYVDLCDEERNQVLAAAFKQYMLNQVTEAVKSSLEAYREYNKPWE